MKRIDSVDAMRVVAIVGVIALHVSPLEDPQHRVGAAFDAATVISALTRFGVPFFFIASGYFWAGKASAAESVWPVTGKLVRRLLVLFLAWNAIYLLPTDVWGAFQHGPWGPFKVIYWGLAAVVQGPLHAVFEGTKVHLWFLMALVWCAVISAAFVRRNALQPLVLLAVALYAVGLLGKSYADTRIGFATSFNLRNGPFFGSIFFVTGILLQRAGRRSGWLLGGALLAIFGAALQLLELQALHACCGTSMEQDFVVGTYFFGTGAALMAFGGADTLRLPRFFVRAGPLTLGIYAVHYAFIDLLRPLDRQFGGNPVWDFALLCAVFFLAYGTALAMCKWPRTRGLVA